MKEAAPRIRRIEHASLDERLARGRAARERTSPASHSGWVAARDRPDPVALLEEQNATREPDLVPVRHGRMMVSPLTYRGAAKGSALVELMARVTLIYYAQLCGWTLARAHARSGDPVAMAEHLGGDAFDRSIADFSERYADQNEKDYEEFVKAISQGASKRPRVSELARTGPPTGPPGHFVTEGLSTAEVRWILPGELDTAIAGWFARFPTGMESREDAYLIHPVLRGLSVKIRAGRVLEVKQFHGSPGILDAAGRARGRIESWQKWSFPFGPLGPDGAGLPGWTVARKRRQMSQFRLADGRFMAAMPGRVAESACAVELTEVRSGGETWWSLGFEATGPADLLLSTLRSTAALMFTQAPPGDWELDMSHSQSYAEWLSRRPVTGVTETTGLRPNAST